MVLSPLLLPGARLGTRHVLGATLGFTGAALLVTGGRLGFRGGGLTGHWLALAAAFIWSTYSLLPKRVRSFPTSAVASFCLVSGLLAIGCHVLLERPYLPSLFDLPWLFLIGVGPMGAAFYLWDRAMKGGDARVIGTLSYLTPLLSTLLIAATGQGRLGPLAAMALVVGGAVVGTWGGARPARG